MGQCRHAGQRALSTSCDAVGEGLHLDVRLRRRRELSLGALRRGEEAAHRALGDLPEIEGGQAEVERGRSEIDPSSEATAASEGAPAPPCFAS